MTHVVVDSCVKCKFTTCVTVCPVNCFHEGDIMLAIDPATCIDCGLCVKRCPVGAIEPESEHNLFFAQKAKENVKRWPVIDQRKPPLKDAAKYAKIKNKYQKFMQK